MQLSHNIDGIFPVVLKYLAFSGNDGCCNIRLCIGILYRCEKEDELPGKVLQLKQLKSLLDDGIITQEDFEAKKKQLLGI